MYERCGIEPCVKGVKCSGMSEKIYFGGLVI